MSYSPLNAKIGNFNLKPFLFQNFFPFLFAFQLLSGQVFIETRYYRIDNSPG